MVNTDILTVVRDPIGWRFVVAKKWVGHGFLLPDGGTLANAFPATHINLQAITAGSNDLVGVKGQMYWPVKAEEAITLLKAKGWNVDDQLRLKPQLGAPFMAIKPGQIGALVMIHMESCKQRKKEFEKELNRLRMDEHGHLFMHFDEDKISPVPEMDDEPGSIEVMNSNQVCLSWHDHHIVPRNADILSFYKMRSTTPAYASLEELEKDGRFVSKDGQLCKDGANALMAQFFSIEGFL